MLCIRLITRILYETAAAYIAHEERQLLLMSGLIRRVFLLRQRYISRSEVAISELLALQPQPSPAAAKS